MSNPKNKLLVLENLLNSEIPVLSQKFMSFVLDLNVHNTYFVDMSQDMDH